MNKTHILLMCFALIGCLFADGTDLGGGTEPICYIGQACCLNGMDCAQCYIGEKCCDEKATCIEKPPEEIIYETPPAFKYFIPKNITIARAFYAPPSAIKNITDKTTYPQIISQVEAKQDEYATYKEAAENKTIVCTTNQITATKTCDYSDSKEQPAKQAAVPFYGEYEHLYKAVFDTLGKLLSITIIK